MPRKKKSGFLKSHRISSLVWLRSTALDMLAFKVPRVAAIINAGRIRRD